ncbi:hypothetical protein AKO1_015003 [Acrasis kona]|uniref:Uncharacterized protein n=1 Tax=Acrasis kona TaxID=1008807 RepID=A0AAW2Z1D6_9EUKA
MINSRTLYSIGLCRSVRTLSARGYYASMPVLAKEEPSKGDEYKTGKLTEDPQKWDEGSKINYGSGDANKKTDQKTEKKTNTKEKQ